ncbi:MAG TPA: hypothetical protein VFD64_14555 [Gemmatimonadaceae bacterium]|nr:hypothetical protein [Gemmatimonadaceae bacterium]
MVAPFTRQLLFVAVLTTVTGCGARQGAAGTRGDRNVITFEQLQEGGYRNALEAVEALRRTWLIERPDGLTTQREVQVYLDNSRLGGIQSLRQVSTSDIASIRYIDAATAINRWGVDHSQGVIMIETRKP